MPKDLVFTLPEAHQKGKRPTLLTNRREVVEHNRPSVIEAGSALIRQRVSDNKAEYLGRDLPDDLTDDHVKDLFLALDKDEAKLIEILKDLMKSPKTMVAKLAALPGEINAAKALEAKKAAAAKEASEKAEAEKLRAEAQAAQEEADRKAAEEEAAKNKK